MDDTFVYVVPMPGGVKEAVIPCIDGYTVYISADLCPEERIEAYEHAAWHIQNGDFDRLCVDQIETEAHHKKGE